MYLLPTNINVHWKKKKHHMSLSPISQVFRQAMQGKLKTVSYLDGPITIENPKTGTGFTTN